MSSLAECEFQRPASNDPGWLEVRSTHRPKRASFRSTDTADPRARSLLDGPEGLDRYRWARFRLLMRSPPWRCGIRRDPASSRAKKIPNSPTARALPVRSPEIRRVGFDATHNSRAHRDGDAPARL